MKHLTLVILVLLAISPFVFADTLSLKNGKTFEGSFKGRSEGNVHFESDGMQISVPESEVDAISFGDSGESASAPTQAEERSAKTDKVTVPSGTILHVRTSDAIDSRKHSQGHKFTSTLEADLEVNGAMAVPKGSVIYGQLSQTKQAGRLLGRSELTIVFDGIMLDNQIKPIQAGAVQAVAQSGSGRDTASKAARGAIIGGLIDGSDGAQTGAKVGLGVALLTRGGGINIPSGTLLDVPLAAPFTP
jgi:hypothetical protein